MKFKTENLFLDSDAARELFIRVASRLPIIDYHNHLDVSAIAEDRRDFSIARLWVVSDPYKHRAMRIDGVPEREINGGASDSEKFAAWARTCPRTWGNPLFHWSAMELRSIFGIDDVLCETNAPGIMEKCDSILARENLTANAILRRWNVEALCTSEDLLADVSVHAAATSKAGSFTVLPSLRGDSILAFSSPNFPEWLSRLGAGRAIKSMDAYFGALAERLDAFGGASCKIADHSLDSGFYYELPGVSEADNIFKNIVGGGPVCARDVSKLVSFVLLKLAGEYRKRGWALQLHIGAERNTSSRLRGLAGPAGGYATIGNPCDMPSIVRFFDDAEKNGGLPKVILHTLNPSDNEAFATLTGSFSEDGVWGKVQFGPAWWYNDHLEGIREHLRALSGYGLLSRFVGMTTDSRSLFSFSRHEYFRRILCGYIGGLAERGEIPGDFDFLAKAVSDISYSNAKNWIFNL